MPPLFPFLAVFWALRLQLSLPEMGVGSSASATEGATLPFTFRLNGMSCPMKELGIAGFRTKK